MRLGHLEEEGLLVAHVALQRRDVRIREGDDRRDGLRRRILVGDGVVVDRDGKPPDVHLKVEDDGLVEVVDAVHDVAVAVLPRTKVGQVLIARDPRPRGRANDIVGDLAAVGAHDRPREFAVLGQVEVAPAVAQEVVPEHVVNTTVVHVDRARLQRILRLEHLLRLVGIVATHLRGDPLAALLCRRRLREDRLRDRRIGHTERLQRHDRRKRSLRRERPAERHQHRERRTHAERGAEASAAPRRRHRVHRRDVGQRPCR
mmetsp:Transcript_40189/g.99986  ORF Transcript_40189/g.99986 Transcript_40189/m.99986 type:complete len:259 (+) Transcript_40189:1423-2199(+)